MLWRAHHVQDKIADHPHAFDTVDTVTVEVDVNLMLIGFDKLNSDFSSVKNGILEELNDQKIQRFLQVNKNTIREREESHVRYKIHYHFIDVHPMVQIYLSQFMKSSIRDIDINLVNVKVINPYDLLNEFRDLFSYIHSNSNMPVPNSNDLIIVVMNSQLKLEGRYGFSTEFSYNEQQKMIDEIFRENSEFAIGEFIFPLTEPITSNDRYVETPEEEGVQMGGGLHGVEEHPISGVPDFSTTFTENYCVLDWREMSFLWAHSKYLQLLEQDPRGMYRSSQDRVRHNLELLRDSYDKKEQMRILLMMKQLLNNDFMMNDDLVNLVEGTFVVSDYILIKQFLFIDVSAGPFEWGSIHDDSNMRTKSSFVWANDYQDVLSCYDRLSDALIDHVKRVSHFVSLSCVSKQSECEHDLSEIQRIQKVVTMDSSTTTDLYRCLISLIELERKYENKERKLKFNERNGREMEVIIRLSREISDFIAHFVTPPYVLSSFDSDFDTNSDFASNSISISTSTSTSSSSSFSTSNSNSNSNSNLNLLSDDSTFSTFEYPIPFESISSSTSASSSPSKSNSNLHSTSQSRFDSSFHFSSSSRIGSSPSFDSKAGSQFQPGIGVSFPSKSNSEKAPLDLHRNLHHISCDHSQQLYRLAIDPNAAAHIHTKHDLQEALHRGVFEPSVPKKKIHFQVNYFTREEFEGIFTVDENYFDFSIFRSEVEKLKLASQEFYFSFQEFKLEREPRLQTAVLRSVSSAIIPHLNNKKSVFPIQQTYLNSSVLFEALRGSSNSLSSHDVQIYIFCMTDSLKRPIFLDKSKQVVSHSDGANNFIFAVQNERVSINAPYFVNGIPMYYNLHNIMSPLLESVFEMLSNTRLALYFGEKVHTNVKPLIEDCIHRPIGSVDGIFSANTIYSEFHIAILKRSEFIIHLQVAVDEFDSLIEKMNALPMMEMHQEVIQELHDSFLDSLKEIEASEDFQLNQELMKKMNLVLGQLRWMWELLQQYQVESCKLKVAPIDYMRVLSRSVIVGTVLAVTYAIVTQKSRKKLKEL